MSNLLRAIAIACLFWPATAVADKGLCGFWHNAENDVTIEITRADTIHTGVIRNHSDPRANGQRMLQLTDYDANSKQWRGSLYALKRRKQLDAVARLKSDSVLEVTATAGWFNKTLLWSRIERPTADQQ